MSTLIPFRQYARDHVERARSLLGGQGQDLIYACLELRLAIEALAYDTLQNYAEDSSSEINAAHQQWQPNKVLEHLRTYDPIADMALRLEMREVAADGGPQPGPPFLTATDDRFTVEWAEKAHRSMGSFLHQRTISQIKKGKAVDQVTLRKEANRVIERLDSIIKSEVSNIRIRLRFEYPCPDCGAGVDVAMAPLLLKGKAVASCPSCCVEWHVTSSDEAGSPHFSRL